MRKTLILLSLVLSASAAADDKASEEDQLKQLREKVARRVEKKRAKHDEALQKLLDDLDSPSNTVRSRAISNILATRDTRLIPTITMLLHDPSAFNRRHAILALYKLKAPNVADKIAPLMLDRDPQVQHTAAEYGSALGYKANMGEIDRFLDRPDFTSQSAAMHLINTLPGKEAAPMLAEFLDHKSHHLRKRAIWGLLALKTSLVQPYALKIIKLAGDSDTWVRNEVSRSETKLMDMLKTDEIRNLTTHTSPNVRAAAFRMLGKKGVDILAEMTAHLSSKDAVLRLEAVKYFSSKRKGPEKAIVKLLNDPDRTVRAYALYGMKTLRFESAEPILRNIVAEGNRSDRKHAAAALLAMNKRIIPRTEPPKVSGPVFQAAAELAAGKQENWKKLLDKTNAMVEGLSKLEGFPCDTKKLLSPDAAGKLPITKKGAGRLYRTRYVGSDSPGSLGEAVVAVHGNLEIKGVINKSIIIVTGDFYVHDGYIYNSIVLVQGKIVSNGYLYNSIVLAGGDKLMAIDNGYIYDSIAAAGEIVCDSYYKNSLLSGKISSVRERTDLRNSSMIDAKLIYKYLYDK
ncbi:MAG: HEAT repeat domain-containing protein [Phycisphaerae bacterium]|jgi:HEAT repeat protein|nr:HEAT repeat domain-containing protein [Phycisphaerae bacterium]